MTYTAEEREQFKTNLRKIQAYTQENYCPQLRKTERVSVDFGELKRYPGQFDMEHEHSFSFDANGNVWYRTGGLVLAFNDENHIWHSIFDSWMYAEDLLLSWTHIKRLVENELDKRDSKRRAIASFEV